MNKRLIKILHGVFWGLLILSDALPAYLSNSYVLPAKQLSGTSLFIESLLICCGYRSITAICFYSSYLLVARQLFVYKRYFKAAVYALIALVAIIAIRYFIEFYLFKPLLGFDNYSKLDVTFKYYVTNVFFYYFPSYFLYGLMYFLIENWYINAQKQQNIQQEKLTTEIAFLRSQINPHFLFNTINDIHTLTYQKAEQAPDALLKLSGLLRYMLSDSQSDFMPLSKEIDYLRNIIDLQLISAKGNAFIEFTINGNIDKQQIAPLLFISFVENAFKHGVLSDKNNPVKIALTVNQNFLEFICINQKSFSQKDRIGGIGLNNVSRRLALLYPENHELVINDQEERYEVNLKLEMK